MIIRPFKAAAFFSDSDLSELTDTQKVLLIGLLALADREGRLLDKPKEIKVRTWPYGSSANVDELLEQLSYQQVIHRSRGCVYVNNFRNYISPYVTEKKSVLPELDEDCEGVLVRTSTSREVLEPYIYISTCTDLSTGTDLNIKGDNPDITSTILKNKSSTENCTSTEVQKKTSKKSKPEKPEPLPFWSTNRYFRMTEKEYELSRIWYEARSLTEKQLRLAIEIVENWLAIGASDAAIKAQRSPDHHLRLFQPWVIKQAQEMEVCSNGKMNGQPAARKPFVSKQQAKQDALDEQIRKGLSKDYPDLDFMDGDISDIINVTRVKQ